MARRGRFGSLIIFTTSMARAANRTRSVAMVNEATTMHLKKKGQSLGSLAKLEGDGSSWVTIYGLVGADVLLGSGMFILIYAICYKL